jgi:hypothetical protein
MDTDRDLRQPLGTPQFDDRGCGGEVSEHKECDQPRRQSSAIARFTLL